MGAGSQVLVLQDEALYAWGYPCGDSTNNVLTDGTYSSTDSPRGVSGLTAHVQEHVQFSDRPHAFWEHIKPVHDPS